MSGDWFYGQEQEQKRSSGVGKIVAVLVILIIANGAILGFILIDYDLQTSKLNSELDALRFQLSSTEADIQSLKGQIAVLKVGNSTGSLQMTQLYNATRNSVVLISVQLATGGAEGSGFVYDLDGRIITNNHVVEGASSIQVTFIDGTVVPATLVGRDPYSDLAVIDVSVDKSSLIPLKLGNSSDLLVGEQVVAIGNPFGLADTMTSGIISAVGRQMQATGGYTIVDVIQTDAAINPGNSGGPLLNMRGEVVGMNTAIVSQTNQFSGIGFAIPSDTIKREVPTIISTGTYQHTYLGISGMDVTPDIAQAMGLQKGTTGALIVTIISGSPADKAGLRGGTEDVTISGARVSVGGDVIIGVDSQTVRTLYDLIVYLERSHKPGDTINLTIIRSNKVMDVQLVLGTRPPPQ
jgi:S1-C subfamily serine protease